MPEEDDDDVVCPLAGRSPSLQPAKAEAAHTGRSRRSQRMDHRVSGKNMLLSSARWPTSALPTRQDKRRDAAEGAKVRGGTQRLERLERFRSSQRRRRACIATRRCRWPRDRGEKLGPKRRGLRRRKGQLGGLGRGGGRNALGSCRRGNGRARRQRGRGLGGPRNRKHRGASGIGRATSGESA